MEKTLVYNFILKSYSNCLSKSVAYSSGGWCAIAEL